MSEINGTASQGAVKLILLFYHHCLVLRGKFQMQSLKRESVSDRHKTRRSEGEEKRTADRNWLRLLCRKSGRGEGARQSRYQANPNWLCMRVLMGFNHRGWAVVGRSEKNLGWDISPAFSLSGSGASWDESTTLTELGGNGGREIPLQPITELCRETGARASPQSATLHPDCSWPLSSSLPLSSISLSLCLCASLLPSVFYYYSLSSLIVVPIRARRYVPEIISQYF